MREERSQQRVTVHTTVAPRRPTRARLRASARTAPRPRRCGASLARPGRASPLGRRAATPTRPRGRASAGGASPCAAGASRLAATGRTPSRIGACAARASSAAARSTARRAAAGASAGANDTVCLTAMCAKCSSTRERATTLGTFEHSTCLCSCTAITSARHVVLSSYYMRLHSSIRSTRSFPHSEVLHPSYPHAAPTDRSHDRT
jgi:hypothetical protein